MSNSFGLFESDEAAQHQPQVQARLAARKMEAAIDTVREKFGRFLLGATGIDEFGDRWHYSKADIRAAVEPYVFPNTGTMRRIHNAMKQDWKIAHPYKLAEDRDAPIQDLDKTYHPSDGNLIPEGNFEGYKNSVDQDGPAKVQNAFTPGGDSGSSAKNARRMVAKTCAYCREEEATGTSSDGLPECKHCHNSSYDDDDDNKKEAARLVADIYTDFARSNGLRVASLDTLDRYASTGIHDADYRLLQSMIIATAAEDCECDDDEDSESDESDSDSDSEAPSASESDESDSDDESDDAPDFGGDDDAESHDEPDADDEDNEDEDDDYGFGDDAEDDPETGGGETYTVPEHAPELDPAMMQEIPTDDPQGSAPVPPEVIDSLLGLPEGTIEQLLLEEVEQGQGGSDGFGGPEQGAPQGGGDDFFGGGGDEAEQEPPRVARRRRVAKDYGRKCPECKSNNTDYSPSTNDYDCYDCGATFKPYSNSKKSPKKESRLRQARQFWAAPDESEEELTERQKRQQKNSLDTQHENWLKKQKAARRFWAADDDQSDSDSGGDSGGGDGQQAAPAQDPNAAMGGGMMPPPGSQAVAPPTPPMPLENQPAEDALLDTANQAIMQMIDRETQEYQQIIDPLSQALQAIQFAQQVEQSEHPMDVTPPQGTVDVSPMSAPGGTASPMQPTASRRTAIWGDDEWTEDYDGGFQGAVGPHGWAGHGPAEGRWGWELRTPETEYGRSRAGYGVTNDPEKAKAKARAAWEEWQSRTSSQRQAIFQTWPSEEAYRRNIEDARDAERARNAPPVAPPRFSDEDVAYLKELGQTPDQAGGGFPDWESYHKHHGAARRQAKVEFGIRNAAKLIAHRYRLSATGHRMLVEAALGRRGYEHVVEALRLVPPEVRKAAAIHMSHLFAAGNDRFNKDVFLKTVMASKPRDRAGDAWRDGRDRGVAEHGRHDMEDYGDEGPLVSSSEPWQGFGDQGHPQASDVPWSERHRIRGSRLPFDLPRHLAGETWTSTPTQDAFEFPNAGQTPRVSDNIAVNELPVMKGADPHGKNAAASSKAVDRFQRWVKWQESQGKPVPGGEGAIHNFLQTRNPVKPKVGPDASAMLHEQMGLTPDPRPARVRVPKPVNPTLKPPKAAPAAPKTASFFTRKVPGWRWDDHLNGYISKEGKAFTCSCGQKVAAPSYKTCGCGRVWNVYAIGDTHHLASDSAEMFIAREIPVRENVIMANRKMAGDADASHRDLLAMIDKLGGDEHPEPVCSYCGEPVEETDFGWNHTERYDSNEDDGHYIEPDWSGSAYGDSEISQDEARKEIDYHNSPAGKRQKAIDLLAEGMYPGFDPDDDPLDPRRITSQYLAMIDKLADWTKYDGDDPSRQGGPKKPPSTTIPKQPQDWTNREFTGPDKGQWRDPDPTELPRKTRKKK